MSYLPSTVPVLVPLSWPGIHRPRPNPDPSQDSLRILPVAWKTRDSAAIVVVDAGATKCYYGIEGEGQFTVGEQCENLGPGAVARSEPDEPPGVAD